MEMLLSAPADTRSSNDRSSTAGRWMDGWGL